MTKFPGYEVQEAFQKGELKAICRATRLLDQKPFFLKYFLSDDPSPTELSKLKTEFELGEKINSSNIISYYELTENERSPFIVCEALDGKLLSQILPSTGFDLNQFLDMAIQLSEALDAIHQQHITYNNFSLDNIIDVQNSNGETLIKLINFSRAVYGNSIKPPIVHIDTMGVELNYLSPEQTGRISREPDYRSDFYSLGIVLYQLLTGSFPFAATNQTELLHCIIATPPVPASDLSNQIPKVISNILVKLLKKSPDDRYRSAYGLSVDLKECRRQLKEDGKIECFFLGQKDILEKLKIPDKLYGRTSEIAQLLKIYQRTRKGGVEVLMLTGRAGVGKSALVDEFRKGQIDHSTTFLKGKFDQLTKGIAYSALSQAFQGLVRQLLTIEDTQLSLWKDKLNVAFDGSGQLVLDVIPDLHHIVGEQPEIPTMEAQEAKNKLQTVFKNFINVLATLDHQLVLFLDDLQWADTGSLELLQSISRDRLVSNFYFIGAYRDDEVSAHHPATHMIDTLCDEGVSLSKIHLEALTNRDIDHLLADTLGCPPEKTSQLSHLIQQKTLGNAFFVRQFLSSLHDEGLISFSHEFHSWNWDMAKIRARNVTNNVVVLMTQKISRFPAETQRALQLASILGATFSLKHLAVISEVGLSQITQALSPAINEGLITTTETDFKFLHDRVQEASYTTIAAQERSSTHLRAAQLLLADTAKENLNQRLFDIVGHYSSGLSQVTDDTEKTSISKLFLMASQKAINSSAFESALSYSSAAIKTLLPKKCWDTQYELTWNLYRDQAYCEYTTLKLEESEKTLEVCLAHSKTENHKVAIHAIISRLLFQMNRHYEGIENSREALAYLGVRTPKKISKAHVLMQFLKFRVALRGRQPQDLVSLPMNTDLHSLNICRVLYDSVESSYMVDADAMAYFSLLIANICLKRGNSSFAPFAYIMLTLVLTGRTREFALADEFAKLAINLNKKIPDKGVRGRVHMLAANFSHHWANPISEHLDLQKIATQCCTETGSLHWANYALLFSRTQSILFNKNTLDQVIENNENAYSFFYEYNDREVVLQQSHTLDFCYWISERTRPKEKNKDDLDPVYYKREMEKPGNLLIRTYYHFYEMLRAFTVDNFSEALVQAKRSLDIASETLGNLVELPVRFYYLLIVLQMETETQNFHSLRFRPSYRKPRLLLKRFAKANPDEFQSLELLIQAEEARVSGKKSAPKLYEAAIKHAYKTGYYFLTALTNEFTAKFYLGQEQHFIAAIFMRQAYNEYANWGAVVKNEQLDIDYPEILATKFGPKPKVLEKRKGYTETLDAAAIIRMSQVISQEIELENLLSKLMEIAVENSGAQRGCLVLDEEGHLNIKYVGGVAEEYANPTDTFPLEGSNILPEGIIRYVYRSGKTLVSDNVLTENGFSEDKYVEQNQLKSVLCLPLRRKDRTVGVVYLENKLTNAVFTQERVSLITTLLNQASISLENAELFEERKRTEQKLSNYRDHLEALVNERTKDAIQAKEEADIANQAKSEFLSSMSHELRTPLNSILGFAQLLQSSRIDSLTEKQIDFTNHIMKGGNLLLELINGVLDLAKIEAGKMDFSLEVVDPRSLLDDCIAFASTLASKRSINLIDDTSEFEEMLWVDHLRCRQIILNLLSNAIKYNRQGGDVRIYAKIQNSDFLRLYIQDTGYGIPTDKQADIFQPFQRLGAEATNIEGTGIGLVLTKTMTEEMNGQIGFESSENNGSTFWVDLPLSKENIMKPTNHITQPIDSGFIIHEGEKLLLYIEDNPSNIALMEGFVETIPSLNMVSAHNAELGIALAEQYKPEAIILDINLPGMNGFEALKQLKTIAALKNTPIIALSARATTHDIKRGEAEGFIDYLTKPIDISKLMNCLKSVLS